MRGASTGTSTTSTAQVSPLRPPLTHVWPQALCCWGISTCLNGTHANKLHFGQPYRILYLSFVHA